MADEHDADGAGAAPMTNLSMAAEPGNGKDKVVAHSSSDDAKCKPITRIRSSQYAYAVRNTQVRSGWRVALHCSHPHLAMH